MYSDVIMAGFGGQGIMLIGNLLAYAAIHEEKNVTFLPSYGVEMRGGTANCSVVISDREIGSPVVGLPSSLIIMNRPSLVKFEAWMKPGGVLILNSSLVPAEEGSRDDIEMIALPLIQIAQEEVGNSKLANMVALGAYVEKTGVVAVAAVLAALEDALNPKYHSMIPVNQRAIEQGAALVR
ncbi:MAG: 2-oxoacid:acceptor oxidoreductase family protein [Deltaproteobacteria bacterium]|nr:2-oxoacid:acceptor oxidoreductase family protein [Candidatus Anaeroferrophillus wilburensis]MBN2889578.1 2-oxoacid:acceptor oxidoreductase family protein [Deltaproteobacteria bacterium]